MEKCSRRLPGQGDIPSIVLRCGHGFECPGPVPQRVVGLPERAPLCAHPVPGLFQHWGGGGGEVGGGSAHLENQVTEREGPLASQPQACGALRILSLVSDLENVLIKSGLPLL